jgi:hypothetical protein
MYNDDMHTCGVLSSVSAINIQFITKIQKEKKSRMEIWSSPSGALACLLLDASRCFTTEKSTNQ